jgi:2-oxoglutarate ferredoxin oxidoreductase subunit alpha
MAKVFTCLIGGKAGEGVKKAAQVIADLAVQHGQYVFQTDDYQSLIKGGHNFSVVSICSDVIYNSYHKADLLISFDSRSVDRHMEDMADNALHYCDTEDHSDDRLIALPLKNLVKKHYPDGGNASLSAIAIFCAHHGIPKDGMESVIRSSFKRHKEENCSFASEIYDLVIKQEYSLHFELEKLQQKPGKCYTGNQLIALGAWLGGLDLYFSYPMTPASSVLHHLAKLRDSHGVRAIHAESELAAINMALGAAFAGKRSGVGSSGGGFALMQEAYSLAGMVEAPLFCVLSSRPGPATGVSTYTAQEDLYFALNQGHGEFAKVVASPDSFERAFTLALELMDLAWETQSPVILLTEKHLSESSMSINLPLPDAISEIPIPQKADVGYQRYLITESGVSPLAFPGSNSADEDAVIKYNSNEHLQSGVRTDSAEDIIKMKDKRNRKLKAIEEASKKYQRVAIYGSGKSVVFAYGSTALELREALKYHDFQLVVPIFLEPFPQAELISYQGTEVIIVEHSSQAQFARLLKEKLDVKVKKSILRYDGRHFSSLMLANAIKEAENA